MSLHAVTLSLFVLASLALTSGCEDSTTEPAAPPDASVLADSGGGGNDAGTGTPDSSAGPVLASEIQIYNVGDPGRALPALAGQYTLTYEDGPPSQGTLRATDMNGADNIVIKRDFRRVGEKVTIEVPNQPSQPNLTRTCTVAAVVGELTYLSVHLQFDPNNPAPGSAPPNEITCLCGFEENVAPASCSR
jgi:hypothetical protein